MSSGLLARVVATNGPSLFGAVLQGEFPNADEFSRPLGRMNSMVPLLHVGGPVGCSLSAKYPNQVICMVGTALLSVPAGVLGAAFQASWLSF